MYEKLFTKKFDIHYDKNSPESRHRRNIPQHNKGLPYMTNPQLASYLMVKS